MAALTVGGSRVRQSPFRESDWDRKLDNMLEDLETSTSGGGGGGGVVSTGDGKYSYSASSSSSKQMSSGSQYLQQASSSYSSSSSASNNASNKRSQSANRSQNSTTANNNFPIARSASTSSLHQSADNMLKDLEGSLKASSNYIESHRTTSGPTGTQEFHEYRSYNSGGQPATNTDFNLERQVQHMMPSGSFSAGTNGYNSGLQSANMVSSVQQNKSSSSSYYVNKVQTNQYTSNGERIVDSTTSESYNNANGERPGSRLKQNIDELDTLLYDLNNAKKMSDGGGDYSVSVGGLSSDDYSFSEGTQGHVKKTTNVYNNSADYNYSSQTQPEFSSRKPPSPSPRRRGPGAPTLSSPSSVRRVSPGPSSRPVGGLASSSYTSNYSSYNQSSSNNMAPTQSYQPPPPSNYTPAATPTFDNGSLSRPREPTNMDGTPTGVSYYTKYHSTHSHQSQGAGPAAFPSSVPTTPRPAIKQTPPKRVDELMTELSEFDSSITHTGFVEPAQHHPPPRQPSPEPYRYRDPSPVRQPKQQSTPGPAVYYPPGEMFAGNNKSKTDGPEVQHATSLVEGGRGKGKAEYASKGKAKDKFSDSEGGKQGAAVVPICLPMCCAAPCVIM